MSGYQWAGTLYRNFDDAVTAFVAAWIAGADTGTPEEIEAELLSTDLYREFVQAVGEIKPGAIADTVIDLRSGREG